MPTSNDSLTEARGHVENHRWQQAADAFDRAGALDGASSLQRRLAGNLAALQKHRPELYARLISAPSNNRYRIIASVRGQPTLALVSPGGGLTSLSAGNDPLAALLNAKHALADAIHRGEALGLCGAGDGYLLYVLAHEPPTLFLGSQQAIHVIEPEAEVLLAGLMIHDYTGPAGPIEQQRIRWYVGEDWEQQLEGAARTDPGLPLPSMAITLSVLGKNMQQAVTRISREMDADDERMAKLIAAADAARTREQLVELFGPNPPRKPRVLLLTTRCTTVLQYSTRDSARAFDELGWETHVVIEPTPYHRLTMRFMRQAVLEFRPDFAFQLDHLRHELGNLFPPNLPFACWAQDNLPNLMNRPAAAQVGLRDFVLTPLRPMYVDRHGYPDRQCVDVPKLTLIPKRPPNRQSDGDDLVYVSNASLSIEQIVAEILKSMGSASEAIKIATVACQRIRDVYLAGGSIPTQLEVRKLLRGVEESVAIRIAAEATRSQIVDLLFDRLSNALYRRQALHWAAETADEMNLRFALYGRGWENDPVFGRFARGVVEYGPALEELTRRTKVNLQIVPYFCLHQRLLDGLVAGGAFLIRAHPSDTLMQELCNFLAQHVDAKANSVAEAKATMPASLHGAFDDLLARCAFVAELGDPVAVIRSCENAAILVPQLSALPHLDEVSFHGAASFKAKVKWMLENPAERTRIADAQRKNVEDRLSYTAGLRRVVKRVHKLLSTEPEAARASAA